MPPLSSFPTVNAREGDRESNALKDNHLINGIGIIILLILLLTTIKRLPLD